MLVPRFTLVVWLGLILTGLIFSGTAAACGEPAVECRSAGRETAAVHEQAPSPACPFKPAQNDVCCLGCPLTLAAIAQTATPFLFDDGLGSPFQIPESIFETRADRPPYPPPRF